MAKKPLVFAESLKILLIEDDPDDIDLFDYALKINEFTCKLETLEEGDQVLPYLLGATELPDIIVLDLNLPKVHGRDVLKQIKATSALQSIPVVILSTSSAREDRDYCYRLGADAFLTKPTSVDGFQEMVLIIAGLSH